jgi:ribosome-associated protein
MQEKEIAERIVRAAQETKAEDIRLYDLRNRSSITDYVIICSGRSQAHVRGIADKIEEALRLAGERPFSIEGQQEGSWALMDYNVAIVHIFHPETRAFYDLDGLLDAHPCRRYDTPEDDQPLREASAAT